MELVIGMEAILSASRLLHCVIRSFALAVTVVNIQTHTHTHRQTYRESILIILYEKFIQLS